MVKLFRKEEVYPDFHRADGKCVCDECGKTYSLHPLAPEYSDWQGHFWLRRLCDGTLVKL